MPKTVPFPRLARGIFFLGLLPWLPAVAATPYRPADDSIVLERLPAAPLPVARAAPARLTGEQAAAIAQLQITRARSTGDPRFLGYAQGVLAPWWHSENAPDDVLLMRATLRQSFHDFDGALRDLDRLLARQPENAQAWLTRATVMRVLGRYPEASAACARLQGLVDAFVPQLCGAAVRGLGGELAAAVQILDALRPALKAQPQSLVAWYFAERAEMSSRAGDAPWAESLYRESLSAMPGDLDLRATYADLLLDRGRARDVLALIDADTAVDALRLRRALALHVLGDPGFAALDIEIREGFDAARRRGEALHRREEARYVLRTTSDAQRALQLAQDNWAVQHEPWDARLLIEAAQAAGRPDAAAPVRAWIASTGYEDARLTGDASP